MIADRDDAAPALAAVLYALPVAQHDAGSTIAE